MHEPNHPILHAHERIPSAKAKELFHDIRRRHEIGKNELLTASGLTNSTLTRVLDELIQEGLIVESGLGLSTGGRRPILYQVHASYGYVFGLDISRVTSRFVLLDLAGTKLDSVEWKMSGTTTPEVFLDQVAQQVHEWLLKHQIAFEHIIGMGVGAVGPLNRITGMIEDPEWFDAPGWRDVPVVHMLTERLRIPVILDNGANTALLAEFWAVRTAEYRHMVYIHAGTGLRLSMMNDNKLIHGAVDMEGAFGQMIIQADGLPYRTAQGNFGALDSYASVYAIEREAASRLRTGRSSVLHQLLPPGAEPKYPDILQALKMADPMITEIVTQAAVYFGIGLANLLNILNPEKVILGGPLMADSNLFFYTATQTAIRKTYHYPKYQVAFSRGSYGEEAIAIGAAQLMLSQLTKKE